MTRGKKIVVLDGTPKTIRLALAETRREWRNTRLAALLSTLLPPLLASVPQRTYQERAASPAATYDFNDPTELQKFLDDHDTNTPEF